MLIFKQNEYFGRTVEEGANEDPKGEDEASFQDEEGGSDGRVEGSRTPYSKGRR